DSAPSGIIFCARDFRLANGFIRQDQVFECRATLRRITAVLCKRFFSTFAARCQKQISRHPFVPYPASRALSFWSRITRRKAKIMLDLLLSERRIFVRNRPIRRFVALQVHVLIDVYAWHRSYLQAKACGAILHSPTTEPGRQGLEAVTRVAASNPLI